MKTLFLTLLLIFSFAATLPIAAQTEECVELRVGRQKSVTEDKIKIKFVALLEDSRCPVDVQCIAAGNAKIKVMVTNGSKSETFDINTTAQPQAFTFGRFYIKLDKLTPAPKSNIRINRKGYTATFTITPLKR